MPFRSGHIKDVILRDLSRHTDKRGWLSELFRSDEVPEEFLPTMAYVSSTDPGIARGPHEHKDQADYFCFVGPSTFRVYMWDNRPGSPTFGNKMVVDAGSEQPRAMIIPAGVVHAYKNIGETDGWVINLPNRLYAGEGRREAVDEVRHENDPSSPFILD